MDEHTLIELARKQHLTTYYDRGYMSDYRRRRRRRRLALLLAFLPLALATLYLIATAPQP